MLKSLLTIIVIYIVCTLAYTAYRVLRHGESISEALAITPRWPVPAFDYVKRKLSKWWQERNLT